MDRNLLLKSGGLALLASVGRAALLELDSGAGTLYVGMVLYLLIEID